MSFGSFALYQRRWMKPLIQLISKAKSILLSTHRQCDGDGLGAELALFYALKKLGKTVKIVNVDSTPYKYRFLQPDKVITYFDQSPDTDLSADLAIIFDTNDERLLGSLFPALQKSTHNIAFVDHHPLLQHGPHPSPESWIDIECASTGEMAYKLIKELGIEIDRNIATALYTSITFDTQLYRYVRSSPVSHLIAAELISHKIDTEEVHRHLFGNHTKNKVSFLAMALGQIEYSAEGHIALLKINDHDMKKYQLEMDESRDIIDMIMNIEVVEIAILIREDESHSFKISLRSKGSTPILPVAEAIGGGGHAHSAGAFIKGEYSQIKQQLLDAALKYLKVPGQ